MDEDINESDIVEPESLQEKALDIQTAYAYRQTAAALRESSRRFLSLFLHLENELKSVAELLVNAADAIDPPNENEGDTNVN